MAENMIEEFCHQEVEATSTVSDARLQSQMEALLSQREVDPAATSQEKEGVDKQNEFLATTNRINDEKNVSSFTPGSEQVLVAELRLVGVSMRTACGAG